MEELLFQDVVDLLRNDQVLFENLYPKFNEME